MFYLKLKERSYLMFATWLPMEFTVCFDVELSVHERWASEPTLHNICTSTPEHTPQEPGNSEDMIGNDTILCRVEAP